MDQVQISSQGYTVILDPCASDTLEYSTDKLTVTVCMTEVVAPERL